MNLNMDIIEILRQLKELPEEARMACAWLIEHLADMKTLLGVQKSDADQVLEICERMMDAEDYLPAALAALKYALLTRDGQ